MRTIHFRHLLFSPNLYVIFLATGLCLSSVARSDDKSIEVGFEAKHYEISESQQNQLKNTANMARSKARSKVVIQDRSLDLKKSSLVYIIERTRALKISQFLVREGVEASTIEIQSLSKNKSDTDRISLKIISGAASTLPKIIPNASSDSVASEFTLNFASASAVVQNFDKKSFNDFLASVGQPNRDAIVIEGYTDSVGNAEYNKALGELRALSVFELMVRQGLPPYRVDTKSISKASEPGKGKNSAADRKVVVRWTQNAVIAEEAAKVEEKPAPATVVSEPVKKDPVILVQKEELQAAPSQTEPKKRSTLDLVAFGGVILPGGELRDHAKTGATYGLGIGKAFWSSNESEFRTTLFVSGKSTLEAKESSLSGPLDINSYSLRGDYVFGGDLLRPFIGLGFGVYSWEGSITHNTSQLRNIGSKNDIGGMLTLGVELRLLPNLFLAPEFSYHRIGGEFSETLFSGLISLRWRI